MFVPSSEYAAFRRALEARNATLALALASGLPTLDLADALALCLVLADRDSVRFGRAAVRFAARWYRELPRVDLAEAQLLLALLGALPDAPAAEALEALAAARGRRDLAEAVRRWQVERSG